MGAYPRLLRNNGCARKPLFDSEPNLLNTLLQFGFCLRIQPFILSLSKDERFSYTMMQNQNRTYAVESNPLPLRGRVSVGVNSSTARLLPENR